MLRQAKEFTSLKLQARDGDIGKAREFYFDDRYWTVRYLVADTGLCGDDPASRDRKPEGSYMASG